VNREIRETRERREQGVRCILGTFRVFRMFRGYRLLSSYTAGKPVRGRSEGAASERGCADCANEMAPTEIMCAHCKLEPFRCCYWPVQLASDPADRRAHRRGRPASSEVATDVARPRSVQGPCSAIISAVVGSGLPQFREP
jgi:hypothetical protein